jgi:elongation factor P hydroxylase
MNANSVLPLEASFSSLSAAEERVHNYQDLFDLFNVTFTDSENTVLIKGGHEPIYLPANVSDKNHRIIFAHGYFASALHEISHWCIAGKQRRQLEDYGYWYSPDGRDSKQQAEFEKVEVKPQAIEWAFSCAAGKTFRVSTDNLNGAAVNIQGFQDFVKQQVLLYLEQGFPPRAAEFIDVLQRFYQTNSLNREMFDVESA